MHGHFGAVLSGDLHQDNLGLRESFVSFCGPEKGRFLCVLPKDTA